MLCLLDSIICNELSLSFRIISDYLLRLAVSAVDLAAWVALGRRVASSSPQQRPAGSGGMVQEVR